MGWFYFNGINRMQLIAQRIEDCEEENGEVLVKTTCLKHCFRGGIFSGVLYSVWERTFMKDGLEVQQSERWIGVDLLHYYGGRWGYESLNEKMFPYFFSCPRGYLDLVPLDRYGGNATWRVKVMKYHRRQLEKRKEKKAIIV